MKTVSREQVAAGEHELALPPRVQEALGRLVGAAKEGLLALSVGVGLGVLADLLEEEVVEVVGAKGRHDRERVRRPSRARVGRGDARRPPRPGGASACAQRRRQRGGAAADLRVLRRPRPADQGRVGADAGRRVDARLPAHAGAGRLRGRAGGTVDVEVGGLAHLHRADARVVVGADESAPRRRQAGGDDDRRARAAGTHQRGRARDHDRRRQDPARALEAPRTRPSRRRCSRIWSSAASTRSRGSCS